MARRVIYSILLLISLVVILFYFDVIWRSPSYYKTKNKVELVSPIMDMKTYMKIASEHRRPYIFTQNSKSGGKVIVVGTNHINDPSHSQFDSIRHYWKAYKPTIALVEGRLGFFFKWIHNPIKKYGESGLTTQLAKESNIDLYTWEPSREDEIEMLSKKHSAKKLAMFYSLRPYFQLPEGERNEENLQALIEERTDYKKLKNSISQWQEIDSIWRVDFPELNWRTFKSGYGYPGYLHDIWNDSNLARNKHMLNIIHEQVNMGETVFITMGASHAPRIEKALKSIIY
ncbi:hypothetical protein [Winogradskyella haliclonae]|uniref:TraB/GumN family protein n=1 Tax=Winogradskyella haliclonae TaxID=2048558 RepID=A0ABQ2C244_9FLAO|nr:hypothetical protein [Winogradskyella haliclonae]GGI57188.1 hypothetical protein GCM10011444_14970 [Winogradskyella haliclonae]